MKKHEILKKKYSPRAQTTRLASFGPVFVIAALPGMYFAKTLHGTLVSVEENTKNQEKNPPRAQTTRLASFGPVFVITALPVAYFVFRNYICNKNIS